MHPSLRVFLLTLVVFAPLPVPGVLRAAPGALDPAFNGTGLARFGFGPASDEGTDAVVQPDGRVVVAGGTQDGSSSDWCFVRYSTDGSLDPSFGFGGKALVRVGEGGRCTAVRLQADGRILGAGEARDSQGRSRFAVVRLLTNGALDGSFGSGGIVMADLGTVSDQATALAVQGDGRIVVAGYSIAAPVFYADFAAVRYLSSGALDPSFDTDGKVLISFGALDDLANDLVIQGDGKIVLAGFSTQPGDVTRMALARFNTNGSLDATFDGDGRLLLSIGGSHDEANAVAIQPGTPTLADRLVVAGWARNGSENHVALARLNLNGTLDTSFDGDGRVLSTIGTGSYAYDLLVQSTGFLGRKILIAGTTGSGATSFLTARYNSDGTLDTSFDGDGVATATPGGNGFAAAVALQSGQILIAGTASPATGPDLAVLRYTSGGSLDPTFDGDGIRTDNLGTALGTARSLVIQPNGAIVAAGTLDNLSFAAARYTPNGLLDPSFGGDGVAVADLGQFASVGSAALMTDGRLVVAGTAGTGQLARYGAARFLPDGTLDTAFSGDGITFIGVGSGWNHLAGVALQSGGRVMLGGDTEYQDFTFTYTGFALARLNPDGSRDTSFGFNGEAITPLGGDCVAHAMAQQPDGKFLLAGGIINSSTHFYEMTVARFDSTGALDPAFQGGFVRVRVGGGDSVANAITLLPDGRILLAGDALGVSTDFALVRLLPNGTLDPTFDTDGIVTHSLALPGADHANAVALQADGRILVAGTSWDGSRQVYNVARFNPDGSLDGAYGVFGKAFFAFPGSYSDTGWALALDGFGRALIAGDSGGYFGLARLEGDDASATPEPVQAGSPLNFEIVGPNPVRRNTSIRFTLAREAGATLRVLAADGRLVTTLVEGPTARGQHRVDWSGADAEGRRLPSGVYFIRLEAEGRRETQRVVLIH